MTKKKSLKRDVVEWVAFLGIIGILYVTGLHVPVFGFIQGLILKTGIIKPKIETESIKKADYNFFLISEDGHTIPFSQFEEKTVFLNFWATWCPPCIAEMPDIHRLYRTINDERIVFVMVSLDQDFQKAKDFVKRKGFDFPIYQLGSQLPPVLESQTIPTTFVIGSDGLIHVEKTGMAKYNTQSFRQLLRTL